MKGKKITFEIVEAKQELRGKNLVSISSKEMEFLELSSGSLVQVGNTKKIILRAVRGGNGFGVRAVHSGTVSATKLFPTKKY